MKITCKTCGRIVTPDRALDGIHCNPCGREADRKVRRAKGRMK